MWFHTVCDFLSFPWGAGLGLIFVWRSRDVVSTGWFQISMQTRYSQDCAKTLKNSPSLFIKCKAGTNTGRVRYRVWGKETNKSNESRRSAWCTRVSPSNDHKRLLGLRLIKALSCTDGAEDYGLHKIKMRLIVWRVLQTGKITYVHQTWHGWSHLSQCC